MTDHQITRLEDFIDPTDQALLRLLRATSRAGHTPSTAAELDLPMIDWQELSLRAARLNVAPLVFEALRRLGHSEEIPAAAMQTLREQSQMSTLYNLLIYQQLHLLLQAFERHGIDVILLKGVFLAKVVYHHIGLRTMSDIDLLFHQRDIERVHCLLTELSFERGTIAAPDDNKYNPPENSYHNWYSHPARNFNVETHWGLASPDSHFPIDMDALWQRAVATRMVGSPANLLSPEDALLHLCIHIGHHHLFQRFSLRGLCDIPRLIDHYGSELDWRIFCERAAEWQAERSAYLVLLLAHRLLHANVPSLVLASLCPTPDERLQQWAVQRVFGKVDDSLGPWASNLEFWYPARPWRERLVVVARVCFPPQQQLTQHLGAPGKAHQRWLGYLHHWGRLGQLSFATSAIEAAACNRKQGTLSWGEREVGRISLLNWLRGGS